VAAKQLSRSEIPVHEVVCFHCQQCAEKYPKGLLEELGLTVEKTHDLVDLISDLTPHHPTLGSIRRGMDFLTRFAVDPRYPGDSANKREAVAALRWMDRVGKQARTLLGIREHRRKK
jgi:HEPN domain-containing protein